MQNRLGLAWLLLLPSVMCVAPARTAEAQDTCVFDPQGNSIDVSLEPYGVQFIATSG